MVDFDQRPVLLFVTPRFEGIPRAFSSSAIARSERPWTLSRRISARMSRSSSLSTRAIGRSAFDRRWSDGSSFLPKARLPDRHGARSLGSSG